MELSFTYSQENCGSIRWDPAESVSRAYEGMTDIEREFHERLVQLCLRGLAHGLAGNMLMPEPAERSHLQDKLFEKLAEFKREATAYAEEARRKST